MRAREYFEQWKESPPSIEDPEDIVNCANEFLTLFFEELAAICKVRDIGRESAARSVVLELDDKWRVFTGMINEDYGKVVLSVDAFMDTLKISDVDFYSKVMVE